MLFPVLDLQTDLRDQLQGKPLTGPAFHRTLTETLARHRTGVQGIRRTLGEDGVLVWAQGPTTGYPATAWFVLVLTPNRVDALPRDGEFFLFGPGYLKGDRLTLAGDATTGGNWSQPAVREYRRTDTGWSQVGSRIANVESDGRGTRFAQTGGKPNPNRIVFDARVKPKLLDQPHVGPLLEFTGGWRRVGDRFGALPLVPVPSALHELEKLKELRAANRRREFDARVPNTVRTRLWSLLPQVRSAGVVPNEVDDASNELTLEPLPWILHFEQTPQGIRATRLQRR